MTDERPEAPSPLRRRGPRPLLLHLTLAMLRSSASIAASSGWSSAWPSSRANPGRAAEALAEALAAASAHPFTGAHPITGAESFSAAVLQETLRQDRALLAGIAAYRRHPYQRTLADPPTCWQEGGTRLLDFGGEGPLVLVVPSLVNRAYVLDLAPGHSLLRDLAANGLHPLLLDWGWPGEVERDFTLTDYVAGRLERALVAVEGFAAGGGAIGGKISVVGYCMGGLLALAAAQRRPDRVQALALLATPWDFHAADPAQAAALARLLPLFEPALALGGTLPIDLLQTLFALLDPFGVSDKYRAFARLNPDTPRAHLFVALEDWLNDGVPLAAPVARETLEGWYGANTPAHGAWRIAGLPVRPESLRLPTFVAVPARDRIVPPESARPLAAALPGAVLHQPPAGHVGMVAGHTASAVLWRPLAEWLRQVSAAPAAPRARRRR